MYNTAANIILFPIPTKKTAQRILILYAVIVLRGGITNSDERGGITNKTASERSLAVIKQ